MMNNIGTSGTAAPAPLAGIAFHPRNAGYSTRTPPNASPSAPAASAAYRKYPPSCPRGCNSSHTGNTPATRQYASRIALQPLIAAPSLQPVAAARSSGTYGPATIAPTTIGRNTHTASHDG